jgi:hypothetical protein
MPSSSKARRAVVRLPVVIDLSELHAEDAAGPQVADGLMHHLFCVEVALHEHEAGGLRGVHRGVAVGRDEVDDVVAGGIAAQEGTSLGVDEVDLLVVRQVAGVVREVFS